METVMGSWQFIDIFVNLKALKFELSYDKDNVW